MQMHAAVINACVNWTLLFSNVTSVGKHGNTLHKRSECKQLVSNNILELWVWGIPCKNDSNNKQNKQTVWSIILWGGATRILNLTTDPTISGGGGGQCHCQQTLKPENFTYLLSRCPGTDCWRTSVNQMECVIRYGRVKRRCGVESVFRRRCQRIEKWQQEKFVTEWRLQSVGRVHVSVTV